MSAPCDHAVHRDRGEPQPPSEYTAAFSDCHANLCAARGACVGHPVCRDCGNTFRHPGAQWKLAERVISLRFITTLQETT